MKILKPTDILICDANVLIDYIDAKAEHILSLIAADHKVYVPTPILYEVNRLTGSKLISIGLLEYEPTFTMLAKAATDAIGKCSQQDLLCLLICKEKQWRCLTNDKSLRKQCTQSDVKPVWGLQLLLYLTNKKCISTKEALNVCKSIAEINKRITSDLVRSFTDKLISIKSQ